MRVRWDMGLSRPLFLFLTFFGSVSGIRPSNTRTTRSGCNGRSRVYFSLFLLSVSQV
jgi:hypothetical protein